MSCKTQRQCGVHLTKTKTHCSGIIYIGSLFQKPVRLQHPVHTKWCCYQSSLRILSHQRTNTVQPFCCWIGISTPSSSKWDKCTSAQTLPSNASVAQQPSMLRLVLSVCITQNDDDILNFSNQSSTKTNITPRWLLCVLICYHTNVWWMIWNNVAVTFQQIPHSFCSVVLLFQESKMF